KKIVCHFHGQDLRNRGVIPEMDAISDLNLTNELDLTYMHPNLKYLFLPYDVRAFDIKQSVGDPITICHATTNRIIKGSDLIIKTCLDLKKSHGIKFILVENQPHEKVIEFKRQSDIFIDHVGELTWGYGMNSLESLSMGVASATYLNDTYEKFIPDHPFINIRPDNIREVLAHYIEHSELILQKGKEGRVWVEKYHDYRNVIQNLYEYYQQIGVNF
ncbi:MAG: glycosyltransferase family 1 protein, partial [Candidatus Marinimicrobia bacterium]|nr:glycosyltransferase family 1 protein [Candidatus Neomarinimicrobiota bacterium]